MKKQILATRPVNHNTSSVLISILYLIGLIDWPSGNSGRQNHHRRRRGRPYVYSPTIILRCFIVRIWFRFDSNRSLYRFLSIELPNNRKIMKACGLSLTYLPSRRTFDRRLKTITIDLKERISTMRNLFVFEGLVSPYILAIDSALLKSKGKVWHASSMNEGVVPCPGIDTDARWGYSHTKEWIFGYKLHMICNTDPSSIIVPLAADVATANIPDNQVYTDMMSSTSSPIGLSSEIIKKVYFIVADPGYDDHELYESSLRRGFQLVFPIRRYKNTPEERLRLVDFY